ncbi:MAG: copper-binding protein [Bryobacteraceae bacterium]
MKHRALSIVMALAAAILLSCGSTPQAEQKNRKSYILKGKVISVNAVAKTVTVDHEKVEGWMDAMEMAYNVDKEGVLQQVKAGDKIKATVYDDDFKLYNMEVVR